MNKTKTSAYGARNKWKRLLLFISLLLLLVTFPQQNAFALSPAIHNIEINVVLTPEGDAQITEVWDVTVASGTEWYLRKDNMGEMAIENFRVSDETGTLYQDVGRWDVDKNITQKARKSGIHRDGSAIELCWGVGSFGDHVFTAQYTMTNMVNAYLDDDGFNVKFVNDMLSSDPQNVKVTIEKEGEAFIPEQVGVWAFGFTGNISVEEGKIVAISEAPLNTYSDEVIILCRFDQGVFQPQTEKNRSFEEVKNEAFVGSDYINDHGDGYDGSDFITNNVSVTSNFRQISSYAMGLIPLLVFIAVTFLFRSLKGSGTGSPKKMKAAYLPSSENPQKKKYVHLQDVSYFREVPFEGAIPPPAFLLAQAHIPSADSDIFGCYLLRLLNKGCITFVQTEKQGFFKTKTESSIHLIKAPESGDGHDYAEKRMYNLLTAAAGADGILQEKEMYRWGTKHYTQIESFTTSVITSGEKYLKQHQYVDTVERGAWIFKVQAVELNAAGTNAVLQLLGFKRYLSDFTIIHERRAVEVHLWQDYLIFAQLFGIAEQVAKDFKDIYPDFFEKEGFGINGYSTLYMINSFSKTSSRAVAAAHSSESRSSGGGGSSSSGGGGGSSGGSSGGGSR